MQHSRQAMPDRHAPLMRAVVLPLVAALLLSACGREDVSATDPAATAHAEPAAILNAFVDAWQADEDLGSPEAFLFHSMTSSERRTGEDWEKTKAQLLESLEGLRADTLDSFAQANAAQLDLRTMLESPPPLHFITPEERDALRATRNSHEWDVGLRKLMRQYPGVRDVRALSAPGVSTGGQQALVYAAWYRGARAAGGSYYLLAWEEGRWQIVARSFAWIS